MKHTWGALILGAAGRGRICRWVFGLSLILGASYLYAASEPNVTFPDSFTDAKKRAYSDSQIDEARNTIQKLDQWCLSQSKCLDEPALQQKYTETRNLLFLKMQKARLMGETSGVKRYVKSFFDEKLAMSDWKREAAQLTREKKEMTLKALTSIIDHYDGKQYSKRVLDSIEDAMSNLTGQQAQSLGISESALSSFSNSHFSKASGGAMPLMGGSYAGSQDRVAELLSRRTEMPNLARRLGESMKRKEAISKTSPNPEQLKKSLQFEKDCLSRKDYLDPKISTGKIAQFMHDSGVTARPKNTTEEDLSSLFPRPEVQGGSRACSAFALTSDMAFELNQSQRVRYELSKLKGNPTGPFDVEYAYAKILDQPYKEADPKLPLPDELKNSLRGGYWSIDEGVESIQEALNQLSQVRDCATDGLVVHRNEILDRWLPSKKPDRYAVGSFSTLESDLGMANPALGCGLIKQLVDNGKPPIVVIDTDGRQVHEDWLELKASSMRHVLNVVGYGLDRDPVDGREKLFFHVRDSFTKDRVHHKISAEALSEHLVALHKITSLRSLP